MLPPLFHLALNYFGQRIAAVQQFQQALK